jgi:hypothetical protein
LNRIRIGFSLHRLTALALSVVASSAMAQGVDVSAMLAMQPVTAPGQPSSSRRSSFESVVWLVPERSEVLDVPSMPHSGPYRLVQKGKQFTPHLLVVQTGSSVEFPNRDPFFHNVFSLFNGKRFDLGLYESGTTRSVRFDREGISYIFCNIHPEMGAIVLALKTPYYAIAAPDGSVIIHGVPAGNYHVHLWSETAVPAAESPIFSIQIGTSPVRLGTLVLKPSPDPMHDHKNKFGGDYLPAHNAPY